MQADPGIIREYDHIFRLYCHESQRVFHDRLVDRNDKKYFNTMLSEMAAKHFSKVCAWHEYYELMYVPTYVCTKIMYVVSVIWVRFSALYCAAVIKQACFVSAHSAGVMYLGPQ